MTTKPKTRKAPAARTGINPKMLEIAAKLDEAYARVTTMHRDDDDTLAADSARETCCGEIGILGRKLARVRATNIEELKLKSRYTDPLDWRHIGDPLAKSIVRDLIALDPKGRVHMSKLLAAEKRKARRNDARADARDAARKLTGPKG